MSFSVPSFAHFGMLIPSEPVVMDTAKSNVTFEIKFWHPFENTGMTLVKPKKFTLYTGGEPENLLDKLVEVKVGEFSTWKLDYKIARPGLYTFVMEPEPYWEPAEDKFIIHYTKAYVSAYGDDDGWNEPIAGLVTEIVPLTKPDALYAGNVFTGKVLLHGKAVAGSEVEVEWYPGPDKKGQAPYESMVTQVVITDNEGIFNFAPPVPGWWGFAALNEAEYKLPLVEENKDSENKNTENKDDKNKSVELGGVLWLYFNEFKSAVPAN
jgi:cobalt/nickel transport protein